MQVATIEIDEKRRIAVHQDDHPDDPREYQDGCSVFEVNRNTRFNPMYEGSNTHEDALRNILEQHGGDRWPNGYVLTAEAEDAIRKHFDRASLAYRITDLNADRDWVGVFIWYVEDDCVKANRHLDHSWTGADFIDGCVGEYKAWLNGYVYGVGLEKRATYTNDEDADDHLEQWIEDPESDTIWGIITTDEDDLRTSAADAFGIPLDQIGDVSWN